MNWKDVTPTQDLANISKRGVELPRAIWLNVPLALRTNHSQLVQFGYLKNVENRFLKGARPVCLKNSPMGDHALKRLKHKLVLGVDWKSRYYIEKWQKIVVLPCPYYRSWGFLAFCAPIRWCPYKQTWIQVLAFPRVHSQIMHDSTWTSDMVGLTFVLMSIQADETFKA